MTEINVNHEVSQTATQLKIGSIAVQLGQCATVPYSLYGSDGALLKEGIELMGGEEYSAWGSDDSYPKNWLCQKLNIAQL